MSTVQANEMSAASKERAAEAAWPDYAQLVDGAPAILWSARADGTIEYCNKFGLEYFGRSFDDLRDWNWVTIVHPDDLEKVGHAWSTALESGKPYEVIMRIRRARDGAYNAHQARALPVRDATGRIVRWLGSHMDLTENANA